MAGQREFEKSSPQELEDYLRGLKSPDGEAGGDNTGDSDSLEDYLLAKAAEDLKAASKRLQLLDEKLDKEL